MRQERGPGRRRWFEAEGLELVVWLDGRGVITGFQLCYDLGRGEHALTWRPGRGFAHAAVDGGDTSPLRNEVPVLTPDDDVPWHEIAQRFEQQGGSLEPGLRALIRERLAERIGARVE